MDKKANRDKRRKNLSYKSHKSTKEQEAESEQDTSNNHTVNKPEEILPNNWSKYEINENDEPEGADFGTLLQEPISNNSHFKFKSEQNWDADIKSQLELNRYFTLDLKLLGEGISTIQFPKRHNYDENLFTYVELESIKKHTETNNQKYKKFLAKKFPAKDNNIIIKKNVDEYKPAAVADKSTESSMKTFEVKEKTIELKTDTGETNESKPENSESNIQATVEKENTSKEIKSVKTIPVEPKGQRQRKKVEDDVDDLLNLKTPVQNADEPEIKAEDPLMKPTELRQIPVPQPTVDLEQWLDDILDD